jgi:tetratricopeptide (TPR) repeat protein
LKIHPNEFLLEELLRSLSREHLEVVEHLAGCVTCRRHLKGFPRRRSGPIAAKLADVLQWPQQTVDYGSALRETERTLEHRELALAQERAEAPSLFLELTRCSLEQRDVRLEGSPRFHTWGVFELLIERSFETRIQDPGGSEELSLLALRLSEHLDPDRYGSRLIEDLRARAWAYIANSCRIRSDLQGAEEAFSIAHVHLRKGTRDSLERAILLDLEASLRRDQRRFDDAFRLLRRAIAIFLQNDQGHRAGRSLIKLSTVHYYADDPEGGISLLYRAIELIDPEEDPRLFLCARHNLIDYLASCGRYLEAQKYYRAALPLYRAFPDALTQNRRKWVKGKIARGIGQPDQAEALFLEARDGFVCEGIPYDTALVSLDLAVLYAEQARTADLKRLAGEMVPLFSSLYLRREALAALSYLKHAAKAESATVDLVSAVAAFLRRTEHEPEARFRELPSRAIGLS